MTRPMVAVLWALLVFVLVVLGLTAFGAARWRIATERLDARLEAARTAPTPGRVDFRELDALPAPVQRYFRAVLQDGAPLVAAAALTHAGSFDMSETSAHWKPLRSSQRIVTRAPGFLWNAVVAMLPGLPLRVHDAYVDGEGLLHASLLGIVRLAELQGSELAQGELMRFLAEAVWYPTALLPTQGVQWTAVDDHSARATLVDLGLRVTLTFAFGADALISTVVADARGRTVAGKIVPTPWEGRWSNYAERDGMRVPLTGEVAWLLPTGKKPYWRASVHSVRYEYATARDERTRG